MHTEWTDEWHVTMKCLQGVVSDQICDVMHEVDSSTNDAIRHALLISKVDPAGSSASAVRLSASLVSLLSIFQSCWVNLFSSKTETPLRTGWRGSITCDRKVVVPVETLLRSNLGQVEVEPVSHGDKGESILVVSVTWFRQQRLKHCIIIRFGGNNWLMAAR